MNIRVAASIVAILFPSMLGVRADEPRPLAIVPQPLRVERKTGTFVLSKNTVILADRDSADAANVAGQLAERLSRSTGFRLSASPADGNAPVHDTILFTLKSANPALGAEGYTLEATSDGVVVAATDGPGLFYGMQTLLQLLPPQVFGSSPPAEPTAWKMPVVHILDRPRFHWRGLLLDVARHFFNKEEVKNFLDLMAQHKLNTFQWHLTDDQGWRIEIKHYPKLALIGAWRRDIGFGLDPKDGTAYSPDGRYGGFYTQDDIREIVAYAKARYITVVPEIEMPGHSFAALATHPQFSCSGAPASVYCVGNDDAFDFIENVLAEVLDLFPSERIHIGGDETPRDEWKKCEKCQARIHREGLKNEAELQSYFIRRIEKYLNAHHRVLIGWDEILEGGLAPNAVVMSWRGTDGGRAAANADHDVVMAPASYCYFDYYQAKTGEPRAIGGFLPLEIVYSFEPVPVSLPANKVKHVLGAAGNLWSEYFPNYDHVQYMAYPRACAMAEATWSARNRKDWEDFRKRLDVHLLRLKAQGVKFRPPGPADK